MGVKKLNQIELAQKYSCKWGLMPNACTPSLVGMASPVLDFFLFALPSKWPKFLWTIVHMVQKIELAHANRY